MCINDNIKFLESLKQRVQKNEYRSNITTKSTKKSNLGYMIDPSSRNINKLFVQSLEAGENGPRRNSFDKYYMPLLEIKDFIALINNKPFCNQPIRINE